MGLSHQVGIGFGWWEEVAGAVRLDCELSQQVQGRAPVPRASCFPPRFRRIVWWGVGLVGMGTHPSTDQPRNALLQGLVGGGNMVRMRQQRDVRIE